MANTNITLSADEALIAKARAYAQERGESLNDMMRDYMRKLTGSLEADAAAAEFAELARSASGRSPRAFKFDRTSVHERRKSK